MISYYLYDFKNVKNTHGGGLRLKVTLLHGCFSRFLNCTNGTKSHKTSNILVDKTVDLGVTMVTYKTSILEIHIFVSKIKILVERNIK